MILFIKKIDFVSLLKLILALSCHGEGLKRVTKIIHSFCPRHKIEASKVIQKERKHGGDMIFEFTSL